MELQGDSREPSQNLRFPQDEFTKSEILGRRKAELN
jgi:hypothetical protein